MPKRTIEQMIADKYDDEEVGQHILGQVKDANTADKIVSGELVLPSVQDATRHHQRATGKYASSEEGKQQLDRIAALEEKLAKLSAPAKPAKAKKGE